MAVTKPGTYVSETGVTGNSTACHLIDGEGTMQIKGASSLASTIGISMDGGTTWDPDKDATAPTDDQVLTFEVGASCLVRLQVTSGSAGVIIQSKKLY